MPRMPGNPIVLLTVTIILAAAATIGMACIAGAGAMMVFMSLALHWVGLSPVASVAARPHPA